MDQDMEMPMQAAVGNVISCPDHPNSQLIEDHRSGDCICTECGMVVMERAVDERAEWRTFQDESGGRGDGLDRVGTGEEGSYNAGDLSTKIGASDYGEASNLVQQQQRVTSSQDRVFIQAANSIRETVAKIHIVPAILDKALKVLRQMLNSRKLLGKSMEAKAAGCLYYACRLDKAPRAIREISEATSVPADKITQCFKIIKDSYVEDADIDEGRPAGIANITPEDLLARFCGRLNMPNCELLKAKQMAARIQKLQLLIGRNVTTITAAAILMTLPSASTGPSNKELDAVAGACGITIATLRRAYEQLMPMRAELLFGNDNDDQWMADA